MLLPLDFFVINCRMACFFANKNDVRARMCAADDVRGCLWVEKS